MKSIASGISRIVLFTMTAISATNLLAADTPALMVTPFGAPVYPSVLSMYWLDVAFNPAILDPLSLSAALRSGSGFTRSSVT